MSRVFLINVCWVLTNIVEDHKVLTKRAAAAATATATGRKLNSTTQLWSVALVSLGLHMSANHCYNIIISSCACMRICVRVVEILISRKFNLDYENK